MLSRRGVLTALATGLSGCGGRLRDSGSGRTTGSRENDQSPSSPTTTRPTPRESPLSVDSEFQWAHPYYDAANTLRVPTSAPRDDPEVRWETWLDGRVGAARIDGVHLLVFGRRTLWTIDRRTGRVVRSVPLDANLVSSPTLVDDGFVAGFERGDDTLGVARFDEDGQRIWEADVDAETLFGPTVAHGRAYVAAGGTLVALDEETGAEVWRHRAKNTLTTKPGVSADVVYATGLQESLYEIDAETGARNWRYGTGTYSAFSSAPTVGDNLVFTGRHTSVAVGRELGARAWTTTGGAVGSHGLAGDSVIAAMDDGQVFSFSRRIGMVEWAVTGAAGRPVVTDDSVVVQRAPTLSGPNRVVVLARDDGRVRWHRELDAGGWAQVADGYVYVTRQDGVVQCLG